MSILNHIGRAAGLLLHPTSLPSGKLDADAWRWLDLLAQAGVRVWQTLPLGIPLSGLSPYQCASAFAVNPALFPDSVLTQAKDDLFAGVEYQAWYQHQQHWLDDFALFMVLKQQYAGDWGQWPEPIRQREPATIQQLRKQYQAELQTIINQQFAYYHYCKQLRSYANERGIHLFGDMPIFVAYDSADVWAHPERFLLDDKGQPTYVTGVPPDYFSGTGQRWGNPHYNWDYMQSEDFRWWKQRLAYHFEFFDIVRIDHFRGFAASWMIPADQDTALNGFWQTVPGDALLASIQAEMGTVPLVAEDLGCITPDVIALRDKYDIPGMSVLQFGFDHFEDNPHKPQNVRPNTVYYTGTHDNDTVVGWFSHLDSGMQQHVLDVLGCPTAEQVAPAMINTVLSSNALLAMLPLQDLLGLGSEARMNVPGVAEGNWTWRFQWEQIPANLASDLHNLLQGHQRNERELETHTTS